MIAACSVVSALAACSSSSPPLVKGSVPSGALLDTRVGTTLVYRLVTTSGSKISAEKSTVLAVTPQLNGFEVDKRNVYTTPGGPPDTITRTYLVEPDGSFTESAADLGLSTEADVASIAVPSPADCAARTPVASEVSLKAQTTGEKVELEGTVTIVCGAKVQVAVPAGRFSTQQVIETAVLGPANDQLHLRATLDIVPGLGAIKETATVQRRTSRVTETKTLEAIQAPNA